MVGKIEKGVGWARRVSDAVSRGKRLCAVNNFRLEALLQDRF
jgi:hypothetical protein